MTIPHAFALVGFRYATALLAVIGLLSYTCATYVVEAMACSNALRRETLVFPMADTHLDPADTDGGDDGDSDTSTLLGGSSGSSAAATKARAQRRVEAAAGEESPFAITEKVEMSRMAGDFLGPKAVTLFYSCIIVYLYGDLAIYAVAVPKSLRDIACPRPPRLHGHPAAHAFHTWPCVYGMNSTQVYRLCCGLFSVTFAPFAFFNVTKTKCLQVRDPALKGEPSLCALQSAWLLGVVQACSTLLLLYCGHECIRCGALA